MSRGYGAFFCLFLLAILCQVHGFSMGSWEGLLSEPTALKPLLGTARGVRSDDWMAQLPAMISQSLDSPRFSQTNHLVHPEGHEMTLGMNVPVNSWIALFKPTTWGYFASPDFGLAWHWQFRLFLLLGSSFAFFSVVLGASRLLAAWGAFCLAASSFFAYWSYISEPIIGLALVSAVLIFRQLWTDKILFWNLAALYWVLVAFCLNNLYPPFQIPMIYFVAAVAAASWWRSSCRMRPLWVLGVVVVLVAATVGLHFYENLIVFKKIIGTDYPGARVSTGGDLSFGQLFAMSILALSGYASVPGIAISELGSTYFVGLVALWIFILLRRNLSAEARAQGSFLAVLTFGLALYSFVGVPEILAKVSGWARVPGPRTLGLWTLLNVCWLVWWLRFRPSLRAQERVFWFGLFVFCGGIAYEAHESFLFLGWSKMLPALALLGLSVCWVLHRPRMGMALVSMILAAGSLWFNPVDRKSHSRLMTLEKVGELRRAFEASGKKAVLLLDGDPRSANFLRLVGIPGYGGMHFVPQLDFWTRVDPLRRHSSTYNRFAHVIFVRAAKGAETSFENPQPDILRVSLSENDLRRLGSEAWIRDTLF